MSSIIKLPGILEPGLFNDRYIVESQYVKDSIIVVDTVADANNIKNKNILKIGSPVFVLEKSKFYIYDGDQFKESSGNGSSIDFPEVDGKVYAYKNGSWFDITNLYVTEEQVDSKISEAVNLTKEVIFVDTAEELNSYTPEDGKLYIVKKENAMYIASPSGEKFSCMGVYLTPAGEDGSSATTEDELIIISGGSSETLL